MPAQPTTNPKASSTAPANSNVAICYAAYTLAIVHLRALEDETDNPRLAREAAHERFTIESERRMLMQLWS